MGASKEFRSWVSSFFTTCTRCSVSFRRGLLQLSSLIHREIYLVIHGAEQETKRAVMRTLKLPAPSHFNPRVVETVAKALLVLRHCSIHIPPMLASIVLTYLNVEGYFIGSDLSGPSTQTFQDISQLCLQVTAKLLELLIVVALGVVILDVVRDKMLHGSEGMPLGLMLSSFRFVDMTFLLSHEFRAGSTGFQRRRTRWGFALLVISCALIAILVGPSTALLLIPVYVKDWPGGGGSVLLNGDLAPSTVDVSPSWDPQCTPTVENMTLLNSGISSLASCPWAGFPYLSEILALSVYNGVPLLYKDAISPREITYWTSAEWRTFIFGANIGAGAAAQFLSNLWCSAMLGGAPKAGPGTIYANLHQRLRNGTKGNLESQLPLVRAECFNATSYAKSLRKKGINMSGSLPFPIITDLPTPRGAAYIIPFNTTGSPLPNSTTTQWLPIPNQRCSTTYGSPTSNYPSAFLVIRTSDIPGLDSTVTCSVKAQWIPGRIVHNYVCWGPQSLKGIPSDDDNDKLLDWATARSPAGQTAADFQRVDAWGETVHLTPAWLNTLTPTLSPNVNNTPSPNGGFTTLSSLLETFAQTDVHRDNARKVIFTFTTMAIASFVADGLSRIAYAENKVNDLNGDTVCTRVDAPPNPGNNLGNTAACRWEVSSSASTVDLFNDLVTADAVLSPYPTPPISSRKENTLKYYVTITGWGMKATSAAYYLALTVLWVYVAIALGHISWTWYRGRMSGAWRSLTDFLVLSQTSPAPLAAADAFRNTSTGVEAHETLRIAVRIRHNAGVEPGRETLQLLVGGDGEDGKLERVLGDVAYGVQG
ncbi:hypothetical protein B0T22DRAFT_504410 [Podospora appendiculata]|uniref:Uncharacterized protein n=1 Tax=Podospora appendiculata TaxID=314037 RepID=A0AAE0XH06_9PEZI|nr:hypothetical protein B0T22DRAFT_504410 [Podospora appendiculata]